MQKTRSVSNEFRDFYDFWCLLKRSCLDPLHPSHEFATYYMRVCVLYIFAYFHIIIMYIYQMIQTVFIHRSLDDDITYLVLRVYNNKILLAMFISVSIYLYNKKSVPYQ